MSLKGLASLARDKGGAASVEFALVSGMYITFLFGVIYIAIMMFTDISLHFAVQKSARLAAIGTTEGQVRAELNGYLAAIGIPAATVSYTIAGGAFPVAHVSATLTQSYTLPMISTFNITYSAETYVPQGS